MKFWCISCLTAHSIRVIIQVILLNDPHRADGLTANTPHFMILLRSTSVDRVAWDWHQLRLPPDSFTVAVLHQT